MKKILTAILLSALCYQLSAKQEVFTLVKQKNGPTLGYSSLSGVKLLHEGDLIFKDLNRNGRLDIYEDWRRSLDERINDLAGQLSKEELAGLMIYCSGQLIPYNSTFGLDVATYNGRIYSQSGANPWDLTDQQKQYFKEGMIRHILVSSVQSTEVAARWSNNAQAFVEGLGHGIPCNNASDPRNEVSNRNDEFTTGESGQISLWPDEIGMGATFDPELVRGFGRIASSEYRALGITTSLSPQIDLGTEPRWYRFHGTYSEDPRLVTDYAEAYCDGFQESRSSKVQKFKDSIRVNTMCKHWPGGGPCEAGRDAHYGRGKYAVYPNNNLAMHKMPYEQGAFKLKNGGKCAAVMPYYTISYGQSSENVANNFNYDIITRQLREQDGYDGVVCTDWGVTQDEVHTGMHAGKPFGVENLSEAERHLKGIRAGLDQFGGNTDVTPLLQAIDMLVSEDGEQKAMDRLRASARRILRNIFQTGLFENPYLQPEESSKIVGCPEFMQKGYEAQVKSVVMVKNIGNALPIGNSKVQKVYIPKRYYPENLGFWNNVIPADTITPVSKELASKYFTPASSPQDADAAIVFIDSPNSGFGHSLAETFRNGMSEKSRQLLLTQWRRLGENIPDDRQKEDEWMNNFLRQRIDASNIYFIPDSSKVACPGNGYYPISLQYSDYVADSARAESIGQGDPFETDANRSYKGKGVRTYNKGDMLLVQKMRQEMPGKKIVVVVNTSNPFVISEIEPYADAILITFAIQKQAILDVITGKYEPSGLLPFQMPQDMLTVEQQSEDTPHDMRCYKDAEGNTYDFAFGMDWSGPINDSRVKKYKKQ